MRGLYLISSYTQAHRSTRGVLAPPIETLTAQGYDMQFGTNVLGPYFFTKYVFPMDRLKLTK
jgi:NAD(P)-dependent dehydrogenase (short-subunit alcohol dehydrogenase family)